MDRIDAVVIGAGVVGLAVARALALQGREVVVLEATACVGSGVSARNSEVLHAGLYYPPDSLKARLCVRGRQMLLDFCRSHAVAHALCGKLVVATDAAQIGDLVALQQRALANGAPGLQWLDAAQARAMEPALACEAALWSPGSGIVDSHGLMLALLGDVQRGGGMLALCSEFRAARSECPSAPGAIVVETTDGTRLACGVLVNAAGLHAPAVAARIEGLAPSLVPRARYAKGSYFALGGRAPFSRLIYPMPEPGGLGVHLTLDLAGQAKFGPDVQWVDRPDDFDVDPARAEAFYASVRRYWPALPDGALTPAYAGIRPKISGPGEPAADFVVQGPAQHGVAGLVNLFGIESPGLTSCLALAEMVVQSLQNQ